MREKEYFIISGIIFIGAILLHGIRFFGGLNLIYAGRIIPSWISALAALIGLIMACYAFKFAGKKNNREIIRKKRR